ncbi:hypothetical protein [Rhodococcus sp. NPDC049939]|uniref:hypothetical protein n=1 Tax=Rhodococcus sp. NPDC049939 TaxID=3155511 RepID=UPI0033FA900D
MPTTRKSRTTRTALVLAATALLTTTGFTGAADTPRHEDAIASAAVRALTSPDDPADHFLPADFDSVMGYTPLRIDGIMANPSGECSSPVPLPAEFDTSCKAHDLGYDLLRYASHSGAELGPWARKSLDAQLDQRMRTACEDRIDEQTRAQCFVMANVATAAVAGNSWRQGYSTPITEPWPSYALAGSSVAILASVAWMTRHRPRVGGVPA